MESRGRILFVLANSDTAMGEGVPASDGIVDDAYLPPWDTWFAVLDLDPATEFSVPHILLAWIPKPLEAQVQAAIDVSATQPIGWLTEVRNNVVDSFVLTTARNNDSIGHMNEVLRAACRALTHPPA